MNDKLKHYHRSHYNPLWLDKLGLQQRKVLQSTYDAKYYTLIEMYFIFSMLFNVVGSTFIKI